MDAPPSAPTELSAPPASRPSPASGISDRVRARWAGMAGRLGLGFSLLGFLVILLGWNGAAGLDYAQGQLPYLLSGGFVGLGLIVVGAGLTIAESNRRDRAQLERHLRELTGAITRMQTSAGTNGHAATGGDWSAFAGVADMVVAGRSSFHRPDCRLVVGRDDGTLMSTDDALSDGLTPCRVCKP